MRRFLYLVMAVSLMAGCAVPSDDLQSAEPVGRSSGTTSPAPDAGNIAINAVHALNLALEVEGWFPPSPSSALENRATRIEEVRLIAPSDLRLSDLEVAGEEVSNPVWLVVLRGAWRVPDWLMEIEKRAPPEADWAVVEEIRVFVDSQTGERLGWDTIEALDRSEDRAFPSPGGRWIATFRPPEARLQIAGQDGIFDLSMSVGREVDGVSWSPDEAALVVTLTDRAGVAPPEIWVARELSGTFEEFESAVQPPGLMNVTGLEFASWSPDSKYLLFWVGPASASIAADGLALWSLDVHTGRPRQLSTDALLNPAYQTWSPDGERLAFIDGGYRSALVNKRLTIVSMETGERWVAVPEDEQVPGAIAWSPDGEIVAYAAVEADQTGQKWADWTGWDSPAIQARRVYLIDPDSGIYRRVNETEAYQDAPRWSANGEILYFVQIDGNEAKVMTADPETGQARPKPGCRSSLPETAGYYGQIDWGELYADCLPPSEPAALPSFDFGSVIPWSEVEYFRSAETDLIERSQLQSSTAAECGLSVEEAQARVSFEVRLPSGLPSDYSLQEACNSAGPESVSFCYAYSQGAQSLPRLCVIEQEREFDDLIGPRAEIHRTQEGDLKIEYVRGGWLHVPGTEQFQWDERMVPSIRLRFHSRGMYIQIGYLEDCHDDEVACLSMSQLMAIASSLE